MEFKGSKGEWVKFNDRVEVWSGNLQLKVCDVSTGSYKEANQRLISDAGNVRQQINFDLPELLRQRNEMLKMLEEIVEAQFGNGSLAALNSKIAEAKQLIKEATDVNP